jgi:hypothetical protein
MSRRKSRTPDFIIIGSCIATGAIFAGWNRASLAPEHYTLGLGVGLLLTWLLIRARHAQMTEKWTLAVLMTGAALVLHLQAPRDRGGMQMSDDLAAELRRIDETIDQHEFPKEVLGDGDGVSRSQ